MASSIAPLLFVLSVAGLAAACSSEPAAVPEPIPPAERDVLFAADDPLRALADDLSQLPTDLAAFEARFGVGRQCARPDSKEIYVDEERSSRYGGRQVPAPVLLPRVAITGCATARESFSLLVAETSPAEPIPGTSATDPIAGAPVEVMSFDPVQKRYAFFELLVRDGKPTVIRIERSEDGTVREHEKTLGSPLLTRPAAGPRCFGCHVHGEPMLVELSDPWHGWISANKLAPERRDYTGQTAELVAEAHTADGARTSLASALEVTVRQGIAQLVSSPRYGVAGFERTAAAQAAFCPTTLGFATRGGSYPDALFVDPQVLRDLGIGIQPIVSGSAAAVQVPVRAHVDEKLEAMLGTSGLVRPTLLKALRAFDDEHDLSDTRCALWSALPSGWVDRAPDERSSLLASQLLARTPDDGTPRSQYVRALALGDTPEPAALQAYRDDLLARVAARGADLDTWLPAEIARRHAVAAQLFDRPENPLPLP